MFQIDKSLNAHIKIYQKYFEKLSLDFTGKTSGSYQITNVKLW